MYLCETCGTCSKPKVPCLRRWGFLGYYRELKVCARCYSALASGRTVQQVLRNLGLGAPPVNQPTQFALPTTTQRI